MRCLSTFSGCGWAYGFTLTSLPPQTFSQICESWVKSYLMQVCKPCHYALVEAVEPFKLHSMSMPYMYERFEHLLRLWMCIWLQIHSITTTDASPDLGKFTEILPDAIVKTMPLCFDWGCRTLQTASHIHVIHIWGVWALLRIWMVIWLHTHTVTTTDVSPDLWDLAEILPDASVQTMPLCFGWGCRTFQTASHVMSYIYEVFEHLLRLWMGIWLHNHTINTILWINLLKQKNCVGVILYFYLELSWSYGKMLQGLHRTHILPCFPLLLVLFYK